MRRKNNKRQYNKCQILYVRYRVSDFGYVLCIINSAEEKSAMKKSQQLTRCVKAEISVQ